MSIFDRFHIKTHRFPHIENKAAHSNEIASVAVRVSAATYAFTNALDASIDKSSALKSDPNIPFRTLKRSLIKGEGASRAEWFGPEGGADTFVVNVVGGAAFGVLVGDTIFVGFRGTTNKEDWAINLFGMSSSGPLKIPLEARHYYRQFDHHYHDFSRGTFCDASTDARVHAGFYRVAQALRKPLEFEIDKLINKVRGETGEKWNEALVFCGHSLGGALALASGMRFHRAVIYTFGMPRISCRDLLAELPPNHYRYVLEGDPVPKLPFEAQGFHHDMPSICLDPYRGLQKPSLIAKAIRGFASGKTWSGAAGAAAQAIFASEHDMELYADAVLAQ